jgi:hypothetical protein
MDLVMAELARKNPEAAVPMLPQQKKKSKLRIWLAFAALIILLILDTGILSTNLIYSLNNNGGGGARNNTTTAAEQELVDCQPVWFKGPLQQVVVCKLTGDNLTRLRRQQLVLNVNRFGNEGFLSSLIRLRRRLQQQNTTATCEANEVFIRVLDVVLNGGGCLLTEKQFTQLLEQRPWIDLKLFERRTEQDGTTSQATAELASSPASWNGEIEEEHRRAQSVGG